MPHSALLTLSLLLVFAPVVLAEAVLTQKRPTVVYEGLSTIPAQPYYQRLRNQQPASARRLTPPAGASVQALEDRLPLQPDTLRFFTECLGLRIIKLQGHGPHLLSPFSNRSAHG